MNTLQMTETKTKKMSELEDKALEVAQEVLDNRREVDEPAKVAIKVLGIVAKNRQTLTHREAVQFGMASAIASEKELERYVAVTNPQVKKALTGK